MRKYRVAVLGATGAVGREMISVMTERGFLPRDIAALGGKSAGTEIEIRGEKYSVLSAETFDFSEAEFVLGAAESDIARRFAPKITGAGAVFIDNSSAFRLSDGVPLVVPEINPEDALDHHGIISNPNCSTIISAVALGGINKLSPLTSVTAATYQAVSGAGAGGIKELEEQIMASISGEESVPKIFPHRIFGNIIPKIGGITQSGYTEEEVKLQNEGRKIFHLPKLCASCTCVRVPVARCHSIAIEVRTEKTLTVGEVRDAIRAHAGCVLFDDAEHEKYPMPFVASGGDEVYVGRIRETATGGNALFCCGDQLRKGAATNAVQILGLICEK